MKITRNNLGTKIDFERATLPDGRVIDDVLRENNELEKKIEELEKKNKEMSSMLVTLIPNKSVRNIVEVILIIGTIIGIFMIFIK